MTNMRRPKRLGSPCTVLARYRLPPRWRGDRGSAGRRTVRARNARHLAHSRGRCRHLSAGRPEKLSADAAARGSRGRADLRRRPVAADHAEGAGGAGPGMRARDLLPDRQAGFRTSRSWCGGSRPRATPSDITPGRIAACSGCQPGDADRGNRRRHCGGRNGASRVATTTPTTPFFRFPGFEIDAGDARSAADRAASWCSAPISGPATGIR